VRDMKLFVPAVWDLQKGERYVIYDQFMGEADNIVVDIVTWTISCFPPSAAPRRCCFRLLRHCLPV
jgi:hypothetical protein